MKVPASNPDCIFCKVIGGVLPSETVYEDDTTVAFLDIKPITIGHTLVVPKRHTESMVDTDDQVLSSLVSAAKKVSTAVMKATNTRAYNLGVNNGSAAGQIIFHVHFHIIPRSDSDNLRPWASRAYSEGQPAKVAAAIRQHLA